MTWVCGCPQTSRIDELRAAQNEAIERLRGGFAERSTRHTFEAVLDRTRAEHDELLLHHIRTCPKERDSRGALVVPVFLAQPTDALRVMAHLREVALARGWALAAAQFEGDKPQRDNVESAADSFLCAAQALACESWELCGRTLPPADDVEEGRSWWYEQALECIELADALLAGRKRAIEAHEARRGA